MESSAELGIIQMINIVRRFVLGIPGLHCLSLQTDKLHCQDHHLLHVVQDQHYVLPWTVSAGTRSEGSVWSVTDSVTVPLLCESSDKSKACLQLYLCQHTSPLHSLPSSQVSPFRLWSTFWCSKFCSKHGDWKWFNMFRGFFCLPGVTDKSLQRQLNIVLFLNQ